MSKLFEIKENNMKILMRNFYLIGLIKFRNSHS
jgi:hypothetical protein